MLTAVSLCHALRMPKVPLPAGFTVFALTPIVTVAALSTVGYAAPSELLPHSFAFISATIAIACGVGCLICAFKGKRTALLIFGVICLLLFVEAANILAIPKLNDSFSARNAGTAFSLWMNQNQNVCIYELRRSWVYGLDFYAHREIPECVVPPSTSYLAIVSARGFEDLVRIQREHPGSLYVHPLVGPGVAFGGDMRFVGIWRKLPDSAPGRRQPQ
jgi:hypothetical protein